jgi:hypothetical protein
MNMLRMNVLRMDVLRMDVLRMNVLLPSHIYTFADDYSRQYALLEQLHLRDFLSC